MQFAERLEDRLLITGTLTNVNSAGDGFRFIFGSGVPALNNTYTATVDSGVTRVDFSVGGQNFSDTTPANGFAATFNMSAVSSTAGLTATAYSGAISTGTFAKSVNILRAPTWMQQTDVINTSKSAASLTAGYNFDIYYRAYRQAYTTPAEWNWTPQVNGQPLSSKPIIELGNKSTVFDSGWDFSLASSPAGSVTTSSFGYTFDLEILGRTAYSGKIPAGQNGSIEVGPLEGTYSLSFNPVFNNSLQVQAAADAVANLHLSIDHEFTLQPVVIPFSVYVPSSMANLTLTTKPTVHMGLGGTSRLRIGLDGSVTPVSGTYTIDGDVKIAAQATVNVLDGSWIRRFKPLADGLDHVGGLFDKNLSNLTVFQGYVGADGDITQSLISTWDGSRWQQSAPAKLTIDGKLGWTAFSANLGNEYPFLHYEKTWNPLGRVIIYLTHHTISPRILA